MNPRLRNTAALLGVTGVVALAGCGGNDATQTSAAASGATDQQATQAPPGAQGQAGPDLSALAAKLGVSTAKLRSALEAARPETGTPGQQPDRDPTAKLAQELGISRAKVHAALQELGPAGGPPQGAAPPSGTAPGQSGSGTTSS